ncbi:MAG: hypothetical protein GJ676_16480 [Rhodobacteraceae bacterium]|nr:hypothetical protein [Paracoccaceae bacterium]
MSEPQPFAFHRDSRSAKALLGVAAYLTMLAALLVLFQAAWWIVVLLGLPAIPALIQLWRNPKSSLRLDKQDMNWTSGERTGGVALSEVDKMRFDTRWDFSVRVSILLRNGKRIRLPHDVIPPHRDFEAELQSRDIHVERHHFVVF